MPAIPDQVLSSDAVTAYRTSISALSHHVPSVLTSLDQLVCLEPPGCADLSVSAAPTSTNGQCAGLLYVPHRIASATRIRWDYTHAGTAAAGTYVVGIYNAGGTKIVDTGAIAFTGSANTTQRRSETISATTFEQGPYYVFLGVAYSAGAFTIHGQSGATIMPNHMLYKSTGGTAAPANLSAFTDQVTLNPQGGAPLIALSVG